MSNKQKGRGRQKRLHKKGASLHDLERLLEEQLYASSPELRKPGWTPPESAVREDEAEHVEEIIQEELPPIGTISLFDKLISPKKILKKYRTDSPQRKKNYGKHCFFWLLILCLSLFFVIIALGERYFYDPTALYPPLPDIPSPKFPANMQKWTFRYPQPTSADLVSISGDSNHGFYIGGSYGTFLYSINVENSVDSFVVQSTSSHCHKSVNKETSNEIWTWIPSSFSGTVEMITPVNGTLYLSTRNADQTTKSYKINMDMIKPSLGQHQIAWEPSEFAFDGNIAFGNGVWLGVDKNNLYMSIDGNEWELKPLNIAEDFPSVDMTLLSLAFGNGRFVILCSSMSMHYSLLNPSENASLPWQYSAIDHQVNNQQGRTLIQFSEVSAVFVALMNQRIMTSVDGIDWNERFVATSAMINHLTCSKNARCIATCGANYIMESSSGGLTWTTTSLNATIVGAFCDLEDFCVVAGTHGSILASEIVGGWWNVGAKHHGGVSELRAHNPNAQDTLMGGIWKSGDSERSGIVVSLNGTSWDEYYSGNVQFFDFLVPAWNNNHWLGANRTGSFFLSPSLSTGCNWEEVQKSPSATTLLHVGAIYDEFVATGYVVDQKGSKHGITFYSTDKGKRWKSADADTVIDTFAYNSIHETYIGMSRNNDEESLNGLYYSLNAIHWILSHNGIYESIAIDNRTGIALASNGESLFKSTDGGWSWKEINCGGCATCSIMKLGFLYELGYFYQIMSSEPWRIFFSSDAGTTWNELYYPFRAPIQSVSYGAASLVMLTGHETYAKAGSTLYPQGGILSIPFANITLTSCFDENK